MSGSRHCPKCNTLVPDGFKFCGNCGYNMESMPQKPEKAKTMYFGGAFQMPGRAKLILIKGSGQDGTAYYLSGQEHIIGRIEGSIRPEQPDAFLSPKHANFYYKDGKLFVKDENSLNGVFIRIANSISINIGDVFMVGKQLFRLDEVQDYNEPVPEEDGTYYYYTPHIQASFLITQVLEGGIDGNMYRGEENSISIGREGNTINLPEDPFISGNHARVEFTGDGYKLVDLSSRNGTYYKIKQEQQLKSGDFVFIGQQLFRVEIS